MCGIAGIFSANSSYETLEERGRRMLDTLVHRGPNAEGLWIEQNINLLLGHRRLSIQDLSPLGHQPMLSASGRYTIVFNGEIYNFRDLSALLVKAGHHFNGHSDTEVMLAAFEEWGLKGALNKFTGMFAFALWDSREKIFHLCRDRLGEKPLYYGFTNGQFCFASELKAIESIADDLVICPQGLNSLLRYGYINAPYSIYQSIVKLKPGHLLSLNISDLHNVKSVNDVIPAPYWSLSDVIKTGKENLIHSPGEAINRFDEILKRNVRNQLVSDVPVGAFLSGGIDSTLVSAIAHTESSSPLKTFTIGFDEPEYDESPFANKIAKHLGTDHTNLYVTAKDALDVIPSLPEIYDEPFADSSQIPSYLVSRLAKKEVTVCLSGDGGDELFAGYNRYLSLAKLWKSLSLMPNQLRRSAGGLLSTIPTSFIDSSYAVLAKHKHANERQRFVGLKVKKLAGVMQQPSVHDAYDYLSSYWHEPKDILNQEYFSDYSSKPGSFPTLDSVIEEFMYWDQLAYLPGDNLAKVDRASMSPSLETRLPLLSHEIVEFSWRIPMELKYQQGKSKWLMRALLEKYVPNEMFERPKMGFSVPIAHWLRTDLREWGEALLDGMDRSGETPFNNMAIRNVWDIHQSGKEDCSHKLWTILMFLSWKDKRL